MGWLTSILNLKHKHKNLYRFINLAQSGSVIFNLPTLPGIAAKAAAAAKPAPTVQSCRVRMRLTATSCAARQGRRVCGWVSQMKGKAASEEKQGRTWRAARATASWYGTSSKATML